MEIRDSIGSVKVDVNNNQNMLIKSNVHEIQWQRKSSTSKYQIFLENMETLRNDRSIGSQQENNLKFRLPKQFFVTRKIRKPLLPNSYGMDRTRKQTVSRANCCRYFRSCYFHSDVIKITGQQQRDKQFVCCRVITP